MSKVDKIGKCQAPSEVLKEVEAAGKSWPSVRRCGEEGFCRGCPNLLGQNAQRVSLGLMAERVAGRTVNRRKKWNL